MNRIKILREKKGMSQGDLAARIEVSQATLSRYETGRKKIEPAALASLAWALEVEPNQILLSVETLNKHFAMRAIEVMRDIVEQPRVAGQTIVSARHMEMMDALVGGIESQNTTSITDEECEDA